MYIVALALALVSQDVATPAKDHAKLAHDRVDRARIIDIARDWNAAVAKKDRAGEQAADVRLKVWLTQEVGESNRETREAAREAGRSHVERNQSRRESVGPGAKDQHDLRDDRRDLRDDRRDAAGAALDAAQMRAIAVQLRDLQPSFDAGTANAVQYADKRELLAKLVASAQREVNKDKREIREGRRERREDRRERRE